MLLFQFMERISMELLELLIPELNQKNLFKIKLNGINLEIFMIIQNQ